MCVCVCVYVKYLISFFPLKSDKEGFLKRVKTKLIHLQGLQVSTGERKPLALVSHSGWNTSAIPDVLRNKDTVYFCLLISTATYYNTQM